MLDTTVIVIKTLSATGKALGRPKGAKDKVKRKPRAGFNGYRMEQLALHKADSIGYGFITPKGTFMHTNGDVYNHAHAILHGAENGRLRKEIQAHMDNRDFEPVYDIANRAGYVRMDHKYNSGRPSLHYDPAALTNASRAAIRDILNMHPVVDIARHNGTEYENLTYSDDDHATSDVMKQRVINHKILSDL